MFKIGSCYKQRNGIVVRLDSTLRSDPDVALVRSVFNPERSLNTGGGRNLSDGKYCNYDGEEHDCLTLLPGEVDEHGNPIPEQAPEPSKTPVLDKLENTTECARPRLTWADPASTDRFPGYVVTRGCTEQPQPAGFVSTDLQPASAQVGPLHGSAALLKG